MMKKIMVAMATALMTLGANAQTEVAPFVPGSTLDGVNYFMPKTALRLVVEIEKTVVKPGDLSKYAFRYLRLNDVPTQESVSYTIKGIRTAQYGVADSKKAYNIKVKSKTIAPLVTLTNDGILLSVNKEVEQPTLPEIPSDIPAQALVNPRDYMTQEMLAASSTAKLAELCAQEIYDIRESRNELIRGEADNTPKDGAQLQLMLNQLDLQAKALESLFKGTISTSTEYKVLAIVPEQEGEMMLCRFSKKLGLVDADNYAGAPVYISLTPVGTKPASVSDPETDKKKAKMDKGLYYNVPMREAVKIYDMEKTYCQGEFSMGQFGSTEILSDVLFNKNASTKVSFFPENGGIIKLEQ